MKSVVAYNSGTDVQVVNSLNDPGLYAQRLIFAEYMSDPETDKTTKGLVALAEILQVPYLQLHRWKRSPSFQAVVAKRVRDMALDGSGLALAYEELMKIVSDYTVPVRIRQKAAADLAKLGLKREEMYLRYKMAKDKNHQAATKKTFEEEVIEAEYEVLPDA
jgi:uncharacterized protein (UPF0147 family)